MRKFKVPFGLQVVGWYVGKIILLCLILYSFLLLVYSQPREYSKTSKKELLWQEVLETNITNPTPKKIYTKEIKTVYQVKREGFSLVENTIHENMEYSSVLRNDFQEQEE